MGHSAKKKKRGGGGGRRSKGRTHQSTDHNSNNSDENDLLSEEITALCAIFQDDCSVVPGAPSLINIKLRPHSKDAGDDDSDVSALLSVRCLSGYPYKCPKLQITSERGLSKDDADNLLALLHDQANSNAREGRVMIYNLVEAAQEFLSEIVPVRQPHEALRFEEADNSSELLADDVAGSCNKTCSSVVPFVYGFVDLFSGSGEAHWRIDMEENIGTTSSVQSHILDESKMIDKKMDQIVKLPLIQEAKKAPLLSPVTKLDTLEEESESEFDSESESDNGGSSLSATDSSASLSPKSDGDDPLHESKVLFAFEHHEEIDESDIDSKPSESFSSASENANQLSQTVEKDLVLAHLLRLACTSKGQLADVLPEITSELYKIGIISEGVLELATKPSSVFDQTFHHVLGTRMNSSKVSQFWKAASEYGGENASTSPSSRYINDFEELQPLGRGGFGHVVLCKNKLDGRHYAVKKIRLKDKSLSVDDRILREVATLARLQHQHVVRYYQAWYETGITTCYADSAFGSRTPVSSSFSFRGASPVDNENKLESTYLYIQMEYCPRTLRQMFDSYTHFDKDLAWHIFRQIVEGMAHIHGQGIIHRDLTPNNIFFGARNDIKIGDFGLAKFLKREQLDQDPDPAETTGGVSLDRTGQVGTYFYTAPEIEQGWPKIDEKADMYSLGVVFFELWRPFGTAMERHIVLSDLKLKGELPVDWVLEFPEHASLLRRLMSPTPSGRPSATELLKNDFPPRMEFELLDSFLRTMHTSEDTSIYDKVVNAIFEEESLSTEEKHVHIGRAVLPRSDTSSVQYTDYDTEVRDHVSEVAREVFRQHCAKRLEVVTMRLQGEFSQRNRNSVKLLTHGGDKVELCHELRLPFVKWVVVNQKSSFKRYEISHVYRRAIGHSTPGRYLQGDFDMVGGAPALTEAEVIKATMDIISRFFSSESCDIHLNHGDLLDAIWSWIGLKIEHRQKVAELLSLLGSLPPQSSERKSKWVVIRRQLRQELNLAEAIVNRLQMVGLRFCGAADQALPRLRGALPADKLVRKALDELAEVFSFLRSWRIEKQVFIDVFMPPTENYHRDLFFQIYLGKENNPAPLMEGTLLAIGGRYDYLLHQMWSREHKSNPPSAVGVSVALETIIQHSSAEIRASSTTGVLVCSRGGGGLLEERMELVAELWDENIKAEYVPMSDPSLTEQYEYANEHDIRCLVIITDTGVSQKGSVKIRHLELKKEKEVERENTVKFLQEAMSTQFKNQKIWN